jgi:hypothetical protein
MLVLVPFVLAVAWCRATRLNFRQDYDFIGIRILQFKNTFTYISLPYKDAVGSPAELHIVIRIAHMRWLVLQS